MAVAIAIQGPRIKQSRRKIDRRQKYIEKVHNEGWEDINTEDLREFFGDLYRLQNSMFWVPNSVTLANKVFGQLLRDLGPKDALNYIAASFSTRVPPRDLRWFFTDFARELSIPSNFEHYLSKSQGLLRQWRELHGIR